MFRIEQMILKDIPCPSLSCQHKTTSDVLEILKVEGLIKCANSDPFFQNNNNNTNKENKLRGS
jgi:hypothetical protein